MPLALNDRKLLPPGVHDATLKEVDDLFACFQKSDRRIKLFKKLQDFVAAVKQAQCGTAVIVDGSFVMGCVDEPGDIDLILILPPAWEAEEELKPYQYNLVSKRRVKKEFGFDIFVVAPGSVEERKWTRFFRRVRIDWCRQFGWPKRSVKGMVRIQL